MGASVGSSTVCGIEIVGRARTGTQTGHISSMCSLFQQLCVELAKEQVNKSTERSVKRIDGSWVFNGACNRKKEVAFHGQGY